MQFFRSKSAILAAGGVACLVGAWRAMKGIRASREELLQMSEMIGTKNPFVARVLCWTGFIPLVLGGIGLLVLSVLMATGMLE